MRVVFEPERGQRVPVRLWARHTSPETVRQLQTLASQPYVVGFVAAMADSHLSSGVAVGSVFATEATVVPGALGGDLGCGMSAVRVAGDAERLDRRTRERLLEALASVIPVGDATHRGGGAERRFPDVLLAPALSTGSLEHTRERLGPRHLGTLGGGNHFVELDRDADAGLWLLVHSGSRGLGGAVASHHARVAGGPSRDPLAGLDTTAPAGRAYLGDLSWALAFARANRQAIAARALEVLSDVLGDPLEPADAVDLHHNFVAREAWLGQDLLVHRKGAVAASEGALALVPGSMGTASYLVRGLGNPAAFGSCSHGAGRVLTRSDARATIQPRAFERSMRAVVYDARLSGRLVEEAPAAYRDIAHVLEDQEDLARRELRLEPMAVLKG